MSTKPTVEAIRAEVAELVSQCPSQAPHDIAVYLMSKNYRYGIVCAMCSLTEDNCYVNVSDDEDELIDYIAKAVVKHWGEPTGGFADSIIMDTFDAVFGSTEGVRAAKHYADWITTEAYNLGNELWSVGISNGLLDPEGYYWRVGFFIEKDGCRKLHSTVSFPKETQSHSFAVMLSAISGYPMG